MGIYVGVGVALIFLFQIWNVEMAFWFRCQFLSNHGAEVLHFEFPLLWESCCHFIFLLMNMLFPLLNSCFLLKSILIHSCI